MIITEHPKLEKDENVEDRFKSIFTKIETAWGLQYNENRVGVIYTPEDDLVWANY